MSVSVPKDAGGVAEQPDVPEETSGAGEPQTLMGDSNSDEDIPEASGLDEDPSPGAWFDEVTPHLIPEVREDERRDDDAARVGYQKNVARFFDDLAAAPDEGMSPGESDSPGSLRDFIDDAELEDGVESEVPPLEHVDTADEFQPKRYESESDSEPDDDGLAEFVGMLDKTLLDMGAVRSTESDWECDDAVQ